ncbi:MAG: adenylyl-sulfate kinase [Lachnospiraceae bacterium]|jgi:bifunctional enzyme CysN/CysC|nr:adenylyl-sulfate kinase [Lachnospiraceae bacterium]MEE3460409.1 adenylyl-sulfate kinase [Lachnospiraceae bacterium]
MQSLLKFITCGSVDDGKSTLIGHMLYDAKLIFADQERALELDSKVGSAGGGIDYSLLLDGLMAEREQGITIDVAYRYFSTENRSFIVADTPGHEEYTRNMAVGASFADLAVILIDASKGVLVQTKRHTRICALMGIKHVVYAVNKMDLIDYDENKYKEIVTHIKQMCVEYDFKTFTTIPVSATVGDNITKKSGRMAWYKGPALLSYLETIDVTDTEDQTGFAMPVQRVCRPDRSFRGFQGQVEVGKLKVGDEITVLPSHETAKVRSLMIAGKDAPEISLGEAATIQLDKEIDVSRGCVIKKDLHLHVGKMFTAKILWMDDNRLVAGKNFFMKLGTRMVPATIMNIKYKIDVNEGSHISTDNLFKNEIAVCDISCADDVVYDEFEHHKALGGFIMIDRITNMTSACGVVMHPLRRGDNVIWQNMDITRTLRSQQKGQSPFTIWLTGLSGSGKSTLANELEKKFFAFGRHTMSLDGDNIRMGLNKNLGFKEQDRIENIRRIAEVAKLMNDAGLIVFTSFISPFRSDRMNARDIIGRDNFIEIYVSTPLEECEKRDVKGLYKKARSGEIPNFSGISSPYEPPVDPDITIDTTGKPLDETADMLMDQIRKIIKARGLEV